MKNPKTWSWLDENWKELAPAVILNRFGDEGYKPKGKDDYDDDREETDEDIVERVKGFYLGPGNKITEDTQDRIIQLLGDSDSFGGRKNATY